MFIDKYGYWLVNGTKFDDKYQALVHASQLNVKITFHYHDQIWENFDRSLLGKIPLKTLYKERAQQLRDKYDYLILYYSGGADSYNVLRSFIDNNIKLDEICVKWPKPLIDGKFYTPNTQDRSAKNYWSEWNYSVEPSLKWVAKNHPDIKIVIKDFIGDPKELDIDGMFVNLKHHGFRAGILLNSQVSDSEQEQLSKGKTVANIYGCEKPKLLLHKNKVYFLFTDVSFVPVVRSVNNPLGAEPFYWTPDMPLLPFEQAYQMSAYFKANLDQRKFMFDPAEPGVHQDNAWIQQELAKKVVYDNWDYRFQADKPKSVGRLDKFSWFLENSELDLLKNKFIENIIQRTNGIASQFLAGDDFLPSIKNHSTKPFYIETYEY